MNLPFDQSIVASNRSNKVFNTLFTNITDSSNLYGVAKKLNPLMPRATLHNKYLITYSEIFITKRPVKDLHIEDIKSWPPPI